MLKHFLALAWIFFFTFSISPGLCISFLPSGRHLLLFPSIRWESLSTFSLAWFINITKVVPFESVEVFRKDSFLILYFSLFSSMIFLLLCLLPSAVLFTLTIWPFGPPPPRSSLWRPHKELCFDWSAGLSTGVFLSIRSNVRPTSSQWIPTKLISCPTSSYSIPAFISIPLQLFLGSPSTALFPFLNMYLR